MSRHSDILTLRRAIVEIGANGVPGQETEDADVFFNRWSVSMANRLAASREGLFGVVQGQVRTVDYDGQQLAVLAGTEYLVSEADNQGEFTVLTLSRRASNE